MMDLADVVGALTVGSIVVLLVILLAEVGVSAVRDWWLRNRDLPERIAQRLDDARDVETAEDRAFDPTNCGCEDCRIEFAEDFADITNRLADLVPLSRALPELYLVPEVRDER